MVSLASNNKSEEQNAKCIRNAFFKVVRRKERRPLVINPFRAVQKDEDDGVHIKNECEFGAGGGEYHRIRDKNSPVGSFLGESFHKGEHFEIYSLSSKNLLKKSETNSRIEGGSCSSKISVKSRNSTDQTPEPQKRSLRSSILLGYGTVGVATDSPCNHRRLDWSIRSVPCPTSGIRLRRATSYSVCSKRPPSCPTSPTKLPVSKLSPPNRCFSPQRNSASQQSCNKDQAKISPDLSHSLKVSIRQHSSASRFYTTEHQIK